MNRIRAFVSIAAALVAASVCARRRRSATELSLEADQVPRADGARPASATSCRACSRRSSPRRATRRPSWSRTGPAATACSAYDAVAKSPPDGYTDADGQSRRPGDAPHLAKSLPYDPFKSFAPIILLVTVPNILVVHPSVPANSLQGADRLRQGQSRQAELCLARHRRVRPHRGGAAQAARRHRHRARAVPGRRARRAGPRRRPRQHDVRRGVARAAADHRPAGCGRSASRRSSASRCCPTCRP